MGANMAFRRVVLAFLLLSAGRGFAASREILALQRDVAQIQDQLRMLQQSQDQKLATLSTLAQQALDAANKANTAVRVLESGIQTHLKDQEKNVVAPVAGVGLRVDQMTGGLQSLRESITDVTSRLGKLQQQVMDLNNAVKTIGTPGAPPPPPAPGGGTASSEAPQIPAETLYANAMRDRTGGKAELALAEFGDYLKLYGNTDLAPRAQFYIAEIHYQLGDYNSAMSEFDTVIERYPSNDLTADALYMKGMSLVKLGRPTQGNQELRNLVRKYPTSSAAAKACTQIKAAGQSCGPLDR
jgi:TolA-binding protein